MSAFAAEALFDLPRLGGMGRHQSAEAVTHTWLTPPDLLAALGPFDLDPCAAPDPRPWATAARHYTLRDDGLRQGWFGRVWLNPPYDHRIGKAFLQRMVRHGCGTALIFARTETELFASAVWRAASAVLFLEGRLYFHRPDGTRAPGNAGAPSVLVAYGASDAAILRGSSLQGQFIDLRLMRGEV